MVGWHGAPDETLEPFDHDVFHLVPVGLSALEVERYYEASPTPPCGRSTTT
ncbi:hypothetical protein [Kocuria atrinae]|uniref:hypothetical protein n=1 Tax=Kocuria atrinae TaxID=592377 RepID=UPI0003103ED8